MRQVRVRVVPVVAGLVLALASPALGSPALAAAPAPRPVPSTSTASTVTDQHVTPGRPSRVLAKQATGRAAILALGDDLALAAHRNSLTPARLTQILRTDPTAVIYPTGKLAYRDARRETAPPAPSPTTAQALVVPEGQTFTLHSRPGSKHTVYLDFNGADVSGTGWNYEPQYNPDGIPDGFYDAFTIDSDGSTFNTAEHEYIQEVWRVIAETYATFDVDVTTADPGPGGYNRNGPADQTYGDHVLFTDDPDSDPVCDPNVCGGVAFVDVFDDSRDNSDFFEPVWVRQYAHPFDAAIAASHEIGHTLGLVHDGRTSPDEEYYQGAGAWSPIMGAGGNAIQQFSKGEYASASNTQDDLAVIRDVGGVPALPDDAGNTIATATTMGARTAFTIDGTISTRTDYDVYEIGSCTDAITISATGAGSGSALDLRVDVLDATGASLGFSDPASGQTTDNPPVATGVDVPAFSPSTATTYYVKVDGVGSAGATGYSDYGSIGSYTLSITGCVATNGTEPGSPTGLALSSTKAAGTLTWSAPAGAPVTGYRITGVPGGPFEVPAGTTSKALTLTGGVDLRIGVTAFNGSGPGVPGTLDRHVSSWAPTVPPTLSVSTVVLTAKIAWKLGANPGGSAVVAWRVKESSQTNDLPASDFAYGVNLSYSDYGTHTVTITPLVYAEDGSTSPGRTVTFAIATKPSAPRIGTAASGARGRPVTALARWAAAYNGGAAITAYRVVAYRLNSRGQIVSSKVSRALKPASRSYSFALAAGRYKFRVVAYNQKGASPKSAYSKAVTAR
ncbi:MAG: hypothetical protein NTV23_12030 [Propionibacteriales bacterium]|nr:hypothetical protein [Propionibacteriales bacterium]